MSGVRYGDWGTGRIGIVGLRGGGLQGEVLLFVEAIYSFIKLCTLNQLAV